MFLISHPIRRIHVEIFLLSPATPLARSRFEWTTGELMPCTPAARNASLACLGLSPVTFSEKAVRKIKDRRTPVQSWFLDTTLVMGYWGSGQQRSYHHTAPVNALYALHEEALLMLEQEGLEEVWNRHRRVHRSLVQGLEKRVLHLAVPESERIPQLNAVLVPEGVDEAAVRRQLLEDHGNRDWSRTGGFGRQGLAYRSDGPLLPRAQRAQIPGRARADSGRLSWLRSREGLARIAAGSLRYVALSTDRMAERNAEKDSIWPWGVS